MDSVTGCMEEITSGKIEKGKGRDLKRIKFSLYA